MMTFSFFLKNLTSKVSGIGHSMTLLSEKIQILGPLMGQADILSHRPLKGELAVLAHSPDVPPQPCRPWLSAQGSGPVHMGSGSH